MPRLDDCLRHLLVLTLCAMPIACGFSPATPDDRLPAPIPAHWQQCPPSAAATTETDAACRSTHARVDDASQLIALFGDPQLTALWHQIDANNYTLARTRLQVAEAAAQVGIDTAALLPQLDAGLQAVRSGGETQQEITSYQAIASARWEIDLWGRLASARRASNYTLDSAIADLEAAQLSLAALASKRWHDVIQSQQAVMLAGDNLAAVENITRIVRSNYRRGLATLLDVRVAESALAQAKNDVAAAQQAQVSAQQSLRQLAGAASSATETVLPQGSAQLPQTLPALPAQLPAEIVRKRPDIVAMERRYRAAAESWQYARLSRLPAFTLSADAAQGSDSFDSVFSSGTYSWDIAAQLLAPVFDGGALKSRQQKAEAIRQQALYDYGESVFNAILEINSRIEQRTLWQQRLLAAQNLQQATRNAEALATRDYRSGLTDLTVLLNATRDAITAERTLLSTQLNALNNEIDLLLALGGTSALSVSNARVANDGASNTRPQ